MVEWRIITLCQYKEVRMTRQFVFAVTLACMLFVAHIPATATSAQPAGCHTIIPAGGFDVSRIARIQRDVAGLAVGKRIAFWAESFIGTPYDTDPLGAYVQSGKVVCDSEIDCMYLVFRAVELATSDTPEGAVDRALDLRFITKGVIKDGKVVNYDERFEYAEDMAASGKWGDDITSALGGTETVPGSRGIAAVTYIPAKTLAAPGSLARLRDGDMIFFVKDPAKRVVGEIIGHLGIIKIEKEGPALIHASGSKDRPGKPGGGIVKKVSLRDYLMDTKFIGAQVTRFR